MNHFYHSERAGTIVFKYVVGLLTGLYSLTGCVSPKQLVYFQDINGRPDTSLPKPFVPTIQLGDLLSVQVSSLNPEASVFFNPYATQANSQANANVSSPTTPLPATPGYSVGSDSSISLPLIGRVVVAGQTNAVVAERIRVKLKPYLKEPTVSVRNLNFRVTVLGEVARPSLFNVANERITLPEAIGLAGDLTIYGRRENILVIREENGQRNYARLDLTSRDVFQSPYYYLHPNDVIYVEPGKSRVASADRFYQTVPVILSALSLVAIIFSNALFRR
ncbi:polysaccharide biosynthesis/export family protein [Fibrella sp. HMF5335]|uniref:Polysaccharide biosynthesis/export family protein n=1 Tax=Fibrella rubiginis TaxID=2817060 RepID=A0A939GJZ9_9BACT|nr:polysaccharide biosynthesis/export family protein [Fibrella rubiginis]MBO0938825.1 polysaccharide biosynthesis/export family protein [Fibrella rubiginis]